MIEMIKTLDINVILILASIISSIGFLLAGLIMWAFQKPITKPITTSEKDYGHISHARLEALIDTRCFKEALRHVCIMQELAISQDNDDAVIPIPLGGYFYPIVLTELSKNENRIRNACKGRPINPCVPPSECFQLSGGAVDQYVK
ncbi:MAG: hypothetical protein ABIG42_05535 [bacterium]